MKEIFVDFNNRVKVGNHANLVFSVALSRLDDVSIGDTIRVTDFDELTAEAKLYAKNEQTQRGLVLVRQWDVPITEAIEVRSPTTQPHPSKLRFSWDLPISENQPA